jgi:hypothetical protein
MSVRAKAANETRADVRQRCFRCLAWFLLVSSSGFCSAQVITVRIVNEKSGRPLPKLSIAVSLLYKSGESAPAKYDAQLHLKTDANGVVQFPLPQPPPSHLWVGAGLPSEYWFCACATAAFASTQEVIEKGLMERLNTKRSKVSGARPGEIVFVARPFNLFERLIYPLEKE